MVQKTCGIVRISVNIKAQNFGIGIEVNTLSKSLKQQKHRL